MLNVHAIKNNRIFTIAQHSAIAAIIGFTGNLLASLFLAPEQFMLCFYWLLGVESAYIIADRISIWAADKNNLLGEKISNNLSVWIIVSLTGLFFIPKEDVNDFSIFVGLLVIAISIPCYKLYLKEITNIRFVRDYVRIQITANQTSWGRFIVTIIAISFYQGLKRANYPELGYYISLILFVLGRSAIYVIVSYHLRKKQTFTRFKIENQQQFLRKEGPI